MKTSWTIRNVLAIVLPAILSGCGLTHAPVLDPHGTAALAERNLLFIASGLMLIVIVPAMPVRAPVPESGITETVKLGIPRRDIIPLCCRTKDPERPWSAPVTRSMAT